MCTLNAQNRERVIAAGGVDLMVMFMDNHPKNEAIQQEACLAINNLCINNGKLGNLVEQCSAFQDYHATFHCKVAYMFL